MSGTMDAHFACPHCHQPLTWHEDDDEPGDWRHLRIPDAVACVLAYFKVEHWRPRS